MLNPLSPVARPIPDRLHLDDRIARLVEHVQQGRSLETAVQELTESLGFDSFMYGMSLTDPRPHHDSRAYVWTTLPREWVALYDRNAYVEIDPRLTHTWNRTSPYIWDAATIGDEWQVQRFLADAARYGIRSGVAISFRDETHPRIIVALNSAESPVSESRLAAIRANLGTIMLLATSFHDLFMAHFVDQGIAPRQRGAPLSPRERQCLEMAARGLTSADIGIKLGIAERTANFHFSNILSKLGVINRQEAIARAISTGLIDLRAQR